MVPDVLPSCDVVFVATWLLHGDSFLSLALTPNCCFMLSPIHSKPTYYVYTSLITYKYIATSASLSTSLGIPKPN